MTSSGTYNFTASNGEIVLAAYEPLQIRAPSIRQEHMYAARRELNLLFSRWSNFTPNLWTVVRTQTVLTPGQATYSLTPQTVMVLDSSIVLNFGSSNESRRYITPISRTEYLSYANQQTPGQPTVFWMDRLISPTVTFYPIPDGNGPYTWDYFSCTQIQDANLPAGEIPNIPYRWIDAVVQGLTYRLSRIYPPAGVDPIAFRQECKAEADEAWKVAAEQDVEGVSVVFAPGLSTYYR